MKVDPERLWSRRTALPLGLTRGPLCTSTAAFQGAGRTGRQGRRRRRGQEHRLGPQKPGFESPPTAVQPCDLKAGDSPLPASVSSPMNWE